MGSVLLLLLPLTLLAPADGAIQAMAVDDLDDDDIEAMFEELVDQSEAMQAELRKISNLLGRLLEERGGEKRKVAQKMKPKKVAIQEAEAPREFIMELLRDVDVPQPWVEVRKPGAGACGPQGKCNDCPKKGACGPQKKVQIRRIGVGGCGPCGPCGPQGKCGVKVQCGPCGPCGPQGKCGPCGPCGPQGKCGAGACKPCCPPPPPSPGCGPACRGACKPGNVPHMMMGPGGGPAGKGMIIIEQDGERRVEEFEMDGLHLGQVQCDVQDVHLDGETAKIVVVINGERQEFEVPIPGEMFKVEKAGCATMKSCNKDCDSCPGPNFY